MGIHPDYEAVQFLGVRFRALTDGESDCLAPKTPGSVRG